MTARKRDPQGAEWRQLCSAMTCDSVRIRVPRAFLSTLALLFHHVSDAMAGDDRPDHGLAKIREGREYYRLPLDYLYGRIARAEKRMSAARHRQAGRMFYQYIRLLAARDKQFKERIKNYANAVQSDRKGAGTVL